MINGLILEDGGHAIVYRLDQRVRSRRDDRERPLLLSGGRQPEFVQPGEVDELPVGAVIPDRLTIVLRPGPFEEPIGWDYAPPFLECLSKAGGRLDRPARALMFLNACLRSMIQKFTRPHFAGRTSRSSKRLRTIQCESVGAML